VETERLYLQSCSAWQDRPGVIFSLEPATRVRLQADRGEFLWQPHWVRGWHLALDQLHGLTEYTDAFAPGVFVSELRPGDKLTLTFQAGPGDEEPAGISETIWAAEDQVKQQFALLPERIGRHDPVVALLGRALGQMVVRTDSRRRLLTGLPWLPVRTRDCLASVGGLLAGGYEAVAREAILEAAGTEGGGVLADWLCGGPAGRRGVEASLRLFAAAEQYVSETGQADLWDQAVDAKRTLRDVLGAIYRNCLAEPRRGVAEICRMDEESGLLWCAEGATWMDTTYPVATPRQGYPVEIQAFWHGALRVWERICPSNAADVARRARKVEESLGRLFWDARGGYLCDLLRARRQDSARRAQADPALRLNQLAVVQADLLERSLAQEVLDAVGRKLLIPGAVRSLAPQPLRVPLEIRDEAGNPVADPRLPYRGRCVGGEFERRLAYHNGTAWPWVYPGYLEARAKAAGWTDQAVTECLAWFEPLLSDLRQGAIGTLGEMKDGDYPHAPRGCLAYTLSVAEALRVYCLLKFGPARA
jgi:predicted glycogen debranching enzyme